MPDLVRMKETDAIVNLEARFFYFLYINTMDAKLAKVYYSPQGYWKGIAAIKKLANAAKVSEDTAKKSLVKQALWQIYLLAPKRIPRPKFDVSAPKAVHREDLLFLPHNTLGRGRGQKTYKYALTVVAVASR